MFYLSRGIAVNIEHLRQRLIQSEHWENDVPLTEDNLKDLLRERFQTIDYAQAKKDVEPFIRDTDLVEMWSADFFLQITEGIKIKFPVIWRDEFEVVQGGCPACYKNEKYND